MNKRNKIRLLQLLRQQEEDFIRLRNQLMLKLGKDILRELQVYQAFVNRLSIITGRGRNFNIKFIRNKPIKFQLIQYGNIDSDSFKIDIRNGNIKNTAEHILMANWQIYHTEIMNALQDYYGDKNIANDIFNDLQQNIYYIESYLKKASANAVILIEPKDTNSSNDDLYNIFITIKTYGAKLHFNKPNYEINAYSIKGIMLDNLNVKQKEIFNDIKEQLFIIEKSFMQLNRQYINLMTDVYNIFARCKMLDLYNKLIT